MMGYEKHEMDLFCCKKVEPRKEEKKDGCECQKSGGHKKSCGDKSHGVKKLICVEEKSHGHKKSCGCKPYDGGNSYGHHKSCGSKGHHKSCGDKKELFCCYKVKPKPVCCQPRKRRNDCCWFW